MKLQENRVIDNHLPLYPKKEQVMILNNEVEIAIEVISKEVTNTVLADRNMNSVRRAISTISGYLMQEGLDAHQVGDWMKDPEVLAFRATDHLVNESKELVDGKPFGLFRQYIREGQEMIDDEEQSDG